MAVNLLLTFCMPTSVMAVTETTDTSTQIRNNEPECVSVSKDTQSDVSGSAAAMELDLSTVPDIVGEQKAKSAGHVHRLYSEEKDLNSVVFANTDGTRTAYYFDHPVKYLDSDGNVKDISLEIKQHDKLNGAYASSDEGTEYDPTERNYTTDALLDEAKEYKPTDDSFDKIEHGMTLQEVIDIVGRPHVTYSGGIGEHYAWETQSGKYYIVLFHDVEPVTGKLTDEIRKTNLFVWGIYPPKEAMSTNS